MIIQDGPYSTYCQIFPNGKIYVGITSKKPEQRWQKGKGYGEGSFVRNAIEKYGWENVETEIVASNQTEEEAKNFERLLIKQLDTMNPEHGYNLTSGGEMVPGYCYSEIARKRMSEKKRGVFDGENNPRARAVVCIETGEIFPTAKQADVSLGFSGTAIIGAISKTKNIGICGGFHWRYATEEEFQKKNKPKKEKMKARPQNPSSIPVYCEELDRVFPSILAASKELHISQCSIKYGADGDVKNPRKYHWHYVNQSEKEIKENDSTSSSRT